ncbi:MAG: phosphatase PAP2 family protein [Jatrophihabitans sp.]|uniref:phosphatase PAP2 family protein n=1 Tax=Jatrophihabitans sp. TaxID=1932789 RepID=UPI003F7F40D6
MRRLSAPGRPAVVLALAWVAVVALGCAVGATLPDSGVPHVDRPIIATLAGHRAGALTSLMRAVTTVGAPGWVLTASTAVAVLLVLRRRVRDAVVLVLAVWGADAAEQVVKAVVRRTRPPAGLRVPHISARGLSFPSGHATIAAAGLGMLAVVAAAAVARPVLRALVLGLGVLAVAAVGVSRLYLGVHWPTDVLGGWVLAVGWSAVVVHTLVRPRRGDVSTSPRV